VEYVCGFIASPSALSVRRESGWFIGSPVLVQLCGVGVYELFRLSGLVNIKYHPIIKK